MNISNVKTRVFKDNNKYFKFSKREDIRIYSVGFTKSRDIRIYYKTVAGDKKKVVKKNKKHGLANSVLCV